MCEGVIAVQGLSSARPTGAMVDMLHWPQHTPRSVL